MIPHRVRALLRSGTAVLALGKGAMTLGQGVVLVLVARGLGAEQVGLYTLALAVVSPVFLFAQMRTQDVLATAADPTARWPAQARLLLGTTLGAVVVSVAVAVVWPRVGLWQVVLPLAVAKVAETYLFALQGIWQAESRFSRVAWTTVSRSVSSVVAMGTGVAVGSLWVGVALTAAVWLVQVAVRDLPTAPLRGEVPVGRVEVARLWWEMAPLGVVGMLVSLNQSVVRVALDASVGLAALGVFATTAYLVRSGSVLAQAIGGAAAPRLRAAHGLPGARRGVAARNAVRGLAVGVVLWVVGVAVGPLVLPLLFGPEMDPGRAVLAAVLAAGPPLFASTAIATSAVSTGNHGSYATAVLVSLIVTAAAAVALVPPFGLVGGGLAWAAGEAAKSVLLWRVVARSD